MLISQLVNGINASALFLIAALGLVIIFGHMKVVNLAHGELIMIGAYISYFMNTIFNAHILISMIVSFIFTALVGVLIESLVIKKLYGKTAETLLATYGLSIILQQLVRAICGPELKYVKIPFEENIQIGKVVIPYYNIFILIVAVTMLLITWATFYKTSFGKRMRAITENRTMTECLGIDTSKVDTWTFAYAAGLAGAAGSILAPIRSVSPFMGVQYLTDSFMTVVVGGVNSLAGTTLGSGLIGESVTILGGIGNEISAKILVFLIIIIIIRFKPEGLFSSERR